ncbi:MAG: hypothetical protein WC635_09345 [Bacteriovorax sp.]|jgi:pyrrolidone-carboxylate peptidase
MLFSLLISALISLPTQAFEIKLRTDLGTNGNSNVVRNFETYKKAFAGKGCKAQGTGHRVILTGFGLFSGVKYNISGAVVSSMASTHVWPARVNLENMPKSTPEKVSSGQLDGVGPGVRIVNRSLRMNNQNFEVCFITVDVKWDFAAAVFIAEASKFKPELILMSGRGGGNVSLESGAINTATSYAGFDSNGVPLDPTSVSAGKENKPLNDGEVILKNYPVDHTLPLTWNTAKAGNAIETIVGSLGFSVNLPETARTDNNYICNNVSFVLAHAAHNKSTLLAGGKLILRSPGFRKKPLVGFFHFPITDSIAPDNAEFAPMILSWSSVLARALFSQF